MNAERRKTLATLQLRLNREVQPVLSELTDGVQSVLDAEQEAFDNLPESLQEGEGGKKMQEAIGALQTLVEKLGELADVADNADSEFESCGEL